MTLRRSTARRASPLLLLVLGPALTLGCASSQERVREDALFSARKQLTQQLVAGGDWQHAFAYADEMHRQRPEDAEVLVMRGNIYRERNLPREAEADLRAALALDAKSPTAHAALAVILDTSGRAAEAEAHHRQAMTLSPKDPAYLNNLGFSLLARRRPKDALPLLQQAARLNPTGRRVRTNLGFTYAALGDLPRAAAEFEMGAAPAEAKNNLGFAYESRGNLGNAYALYVTALRLDPTCSRARNNLTHVASALGRPVPDNLASPAPSPGPKTEPTTEQTQEPTTD